MIETASSQYSAFIGHRRVGAGLLADVAISVKRVVDAGERESPIIFDDTTGRIVDVDLRGTEAEVVARLADRRDEKGDQGEDDSPGEDSQTRTRGRPKLGVVAREVTLLPRHWDWLASQPGGASAAVRRLVDAARQANAGADRIRQAKEAAYRFMSAIAGDEVGFEEATRALFAGDPRRYLEMTESWPSDVRDHARVLAARAFA